MKNSNRLQILITVIVVGGITAAAFLIRQKNMGGIEIPTNSAITLSGTYFDDVTGFRIQREDTEVLAEHLRRMPGKSRSLFDPPSFVIAIANGEEVEPRAISIWLDDRFVYDGNFVDAWTDRMLGNKSKGFRLKRDFAEFLRSELKP